MFILLILKFPIPKYHKLISPITKQRYDNKANRNGYQVKRNDKRTNNIQNSPSSRQKYETHQKSNCIDLRGARMIKSDDI